MGVEQLEAANCQESVRLTRAKAESFRTSGGFFNLENFSRSQADERVVGARIDEEVEIFCAFCHWTCCLGTKPCRRRGRNFTLVCGRKVC